MTDFHAPGSWHLNAVEIFLNVATLLAESVQELSVQLISATEPADIKGSGCTLTTALLKSCLAFSLRVVGHTDNNVPASYIMIALEETVQE